MKMNKIILEFEKGGFINGTLRPDISPKTCASILNALPVTGEVIHAMWAGEEIFFLDFPGDFEYENPTKETPPGTLAMVPNKNKSFCIFYGQSIPHSAVHELVDVTIFGQVDDVEAMAEIGKRVRRHGVEKVTVRRVE